MRISDWSSDVCSSDLRRDASLRADQADLAADGGTEGFGEADAYRDILGARPQRLQRAGDLVAAQYRIFEDIPAPHAPHQNAFEIGRASCRERGCQYV